MKKNNLYFKIRLVSVFCFVLFFTHNLSSQTAVSSPYTRYGIGDITLKGLGQNVAMGNASIALQSDSIPYFFINNANPASYGSLRLTTADLGANFTRTQLKSTSLKSTVNSASLAYLAMAFPLKKITGGLSIGLLPYSSVGYKVSDKNYVPNIDTVNYLYEGSGGYNQAFVGFGFKPFYIHSRSFTKSDKFIRLKNEKNYSKIRSIQNRRKAIQDLSLGVHASYLFGGIENTRRSIFPSGSNSFNTRNTYSSRMSDLYLDYGMQYAYTFDSIKGRDLKENVKIMFGAVYSAQTNLNIKMDSLSVTYFNNSQGTEIVKDTVEFIENSKGTVVFPMSFGVGMGIKKGEKLLIAADFAMQNWSSYKIFNQSAGLKNTMRVSIGVQYVPNYKAVGKGDYYKRLHYRAGVKYLQTSLELKQTQLTEYAVTFGVGFPVGRSYILQNFSMVNVGVELGTRGTTDKGLIKENYMRATVGFTINDRWFVKPKFD